MRRKRTRKERMGMRMKRRGRRAGALLGRNRCRVKRKGAKAEVKESVKVAAVPEMVTVEARRAREGEML
jgi:hypothetical protein